MRRDPLREIRNLQEWRVRRPADLSIAQLVAGAAASATRTQRRMGELIELWRLLMPEELVDRTVLAGLRNGVLQVKVDSAATAFEVDRLMRGGLESQLRAGYRGSLVRVKTRVEPLDDPPGKTRTSDSSAITGKSKSSIAARPRRG